MDAVNCCKELELPYSSVPVSAADLRCLGDWGIATPDLIAPSAPRLFARDIRLRYGPGDAGRDAYNEISALCGSSFFEDGDEAGMLAEFAAHNARPDPLNRSVVNLLQWARGEGWPIPQSLADAIDAEAGAEAERDKAERAELQPIAERDYDLITERLIRAYPDGAPREVVDAAFAEWHHRNDRFYSPDRWGKASVEKATFPIPLPLMAGQQTIAALGAGILQEFLAATVPAEPRVNPILIPLDLLGHPLFEAANDCVARLQCEAQSERVKFRVDRALQVLAVLYALHADTATRLVERMKVYGAPITDAAVNAAVTRFEAKVRRALRVGEGWQRNIKGEPEATNTDNAVVFMSIVGAQLRWNAWTVQADIAGVDIGQWRPLDEAIFGQLIVRAHDSDHRYRPPETLFRRALDAIARENVFDPALEKLAEYERAWDRVSRLDTWMQRACNVPYDSYHAAVGRSIIGGMVRRIRRPGVKHDTVPILIGAQGTGKSTLARLLAMEDAWFTDSVDFGATPQNLIPQLHGKSVIELSELDSMSKRDVAHIKRFLTTQADNLTEKWAKLSSDHPRRSIFIGTTNESNPLMDLTGNRRFLPVRIPSAIDLEWLRENVAQLIGEAAAAEAAGADFAIPRELWTQAAAHQESARAVSAVEELLREWLDRPRISAGYYITSGDLTQALTWARQNGQARAGAILHSLGYRNIRPIVPDLGRRVRVWINGDTDDLTACTRLLPRDIGGRIELHAMVSAAAPVTPSLPALRQQ